MNRQLPPDWIEKISKSKDRTPFVSKLLWGGCGIVIILMIAWSVR